MTRVLLPGTYDPVTLGHLAIIEAAAREYDRVTVGIFVNPDKVGGHLLSPEARMELISLACAHLACVDVIYSEGYTADYAKQEGYDLLVRGYRNESDLALEERMAEFNLSRGGIPTRLFAADPALTELSSTRVRECIAKGELDTLAAYLPAACIPRLLELLA